MRFAIFPASLLLHLRVEGYFSSTEMDEMNAYTTHMGIEPPYVIEIPKYNKFLVRAVHKF